jgi:hypothetical protein
MKQTKVWNIAILLGVSLALCFSVAALQAAGVAQPPDEVRIDALAEKYEPVVFDHALHDSYASCVECHHHVISAPPSDPVCLPCHSEGKELVSVGCRDCHPVDRYAAHKVKKTGRIQTYHNDTPGLIGAYHQNCISCHRVVGTGPTGCEECHKKVR